MKTVVTLLIAAGVMVGSAPAQEGHDRIILRDGTAIEGRVIEVAADRIDYLPSQGPIFGTIPIERVARIEYSDGRVNSLAPMEQRPEPPPLIIPRGYIPTQPRPESRGINVNFPLLTVSWIGVGFGTWQAIQGYNLRRDLLDREAAGTPMKPNDPAFRASKHYVAAGLAFALSLNAFFLAIRPARAERPFPVAVTNEGERVRLAAAVEF